MLLIVVSILVSVTFGSYEDLVSKVENTLDECLSTVNDVGNYIAEVGALVDDRRRGSHAIEGMLGACVSIQKAVDNYRVEHNRLVLFQNLVNGQEMIYLNQLLKPVSKEIGMPIYVASIDGDSFSDFHNKCDGKGPIVVIVKTTKGNVFGGYSGVSWSSTGGWKTHSTQFLFQLRPNSLRYGLTGRYGVFLHSDYGPLFGAGHDLFIASGALNSTDSYSRGHDYTSGAELNDGEQNFQVEDYVVLETTAL